jgi:peptidyl-prolyl cis-trans isomerase D
MGMKTFKSKVIQDKALDILIARTLLHSTRLKSWVFLSDTQIEQMLAQQPSFKKMENFHKII